MSRKSLHCYATSIVIWIVSLCAAIPQVKFNSVVSNNVDLFMDDQNNSTNAALLFLQHQMVQERRQKTTVSFAQLYNMVSQDLEMEAFNSTSSYDENDSYNGIVIMCEVDDYRMTTGVCYATIFCLSILGNGFLLCALTCYEDLKRATNLFMFCLALFDLLFTLTLPFWCVELLYHWVFGDFTCKIMTAAYFVGIYGSLILLTAMTLDRFVVVVVRSHWLTRSRRLKCSKAACVGAWIISLIACLRDSIAAKAQDIHIETYACESTSEHDEKAGYYTQLILLFLVPFAVIVFCYTKIILTLMSTSTRQKYRTVILVLCIVIAFFICWGPYHIIIVLMSIHEFDPCEHEQLHVAFIVCRILAFSHCCMNPALYIVRGKYRNLLSSILFCSPELRQSGLYRRPTDPSDSRMHPYTNEGAQECLHEKQHRCLREQTTTATKMHEETLHEVFNNSYDYNYTYEDYYSLVMLEEENFPFNIINAICYTLIICISLPGNIFLLWVVLKKVGLSSSADCLLFHLTISDLIFTLTLVPWTVNHIWGWIFGHLACRLFTWFIFLGLYSYMMFITVMTVHRYVAVVYPVFASSVGNRSRLYTHISSAVAWWISVGLSLPEMVFSETVDGPDGVFCISNYNSMFTELFMSFTHIVLFFLLPFLIIVFCYTRMGFAIRQSRIRSRNHAVCIILSIAVGFFICWAPYNIFLFLVSLRSLGVFALGESFWEIIYCITHILAYSHCCLNPLIHLFGGKKFRNYLPWSRGFRRLSHRFSTQTFSNPSSFSGQAHL
ncbi:hypothetical protein Q8A67_008595 [Cirrhinus molitorella]|uniref:G-protein coupled receptors family 1 profile domain-containing protein n=1 Tax=Cirrhinus molitorella TaxID=172907 RepID=A0AA88PYH2_9TELE|nr:hypothetical protein Q8A67_008595 [Cirrhinus molitorella]